jgi:hypothetical protein
MPRACKMMLDQRAVMVVGIGNLKTEQGDALATQTLAPSEAIPVGVMLAGRLNVAATVWVAAITCEMEGLAPPLRTHTLVPSDVSATGDEPMARLSANVFRDPEAGLSTDSEPVPLFAIQIDPEETMSPLGALFAGKG